MVIALIGLFGVHWRPSWDFMVLGLLTTGIGGVAGCRSSGELATAKRLTPVTSAAASPSPVSSSGTACNSKQPEKGGLCNWGTFLAGQDLEDNLPMDYKANPGRFVNLSGQVVFDGMKALYLQFVDNPSAIGDLMGDGNMVNTATDYVRKNIDGCHNTTFDNSHWSDLMIHYYCLLPQPRICYTYGIVGFGAPSGQKRSRSEVIKLCSTPIQALQGGDLKDVTDPDSSLAYGYDPFRRIIAEGTFTSEGTVYRHLDLFQYIMRSATFAFNAAQMQLTLNYFYQFVAKDLERRGIVDESDPPKAYLVPLDSSIDVARPENCHFRWRRAIEMFQDDYCYLDKKTELKPAGY